MKYGVQFGQGNFLKDGRLVDVVEFADGASMRAWVREAPTRREEISAKAYVTNLTNSRNVSVKKAAVSPDDPGVSGFLATEMVRVPIEQESKHDPDRDWRP